MAHGKTDSERASLIQSIYGKPWDYTAKYDMTIDTVGSSLGDISGMLVRTLRKKEALTSDEAVEMLRLRALAAKVKAAIAADGSFFLPVFDVLPEGGALVIRGIAHTPKEHTRIEETAQKIAGCVTVRCELHYRS